MRLGVIRGDMPGPVFLSALEPVSQYNPPTEPRGQEVYVSRPTVPEVEGVLASATLGAGAIIQGTDISGTFPVTINAGNDDLKVRTAATPVAFTTVLIVQATYTTFAALLAAVDDALRGTGIRAIQAAGTGSRIGLEGAHGVASYVETDSTAGGSVANTPLGLPAGGSIRTMPSAADFIAATLPVGGPLDVSTATLNGVGATTSANALSLVPTTRGTQEALADAIAPQLIETPVVIDSFLTGQISELLNANFNPDTRRMPAIVDGPAIVVVQDDGVTPFAATLPTITTAILNTPVVGDITITGTGLGDPERLETQVKVSGAVNKVLVQRIIEANGGSVSDLAIVLKAVLIPGATTVTTSVRVQVRQRVSAIQPVA